MKFKWMILAGLMATTSWAMDVTVYNDNLGLVREKRTFSFKEGVNVVTMDDVSAQIDPTSVHISPVGSVGGFAVWEQNFQYDLVNQTKLMEKYLGREIEIERFVGEERDRREILKGKLVSISQGPVVQVGGKLFLNPEGRVVLPELPEGLVSKPRLMWRLSTKNSGPRECEVAYLTGGLSWKTDYVLKLSPQDDHMDLNAWVTLINASGASYIDAKLKLVAGDVHRVPVGGRREWNRSPYAAKEALMSVADASGFQEKGLFEYHLYTLQRPATLADNETKQIELASAQDVPVKKLFIYDGAVQAGSDYNFYTFSDPGYGASSTEKKVWVMLEFKNEKAQHLGMPLPKGTLRVYKQDDDGALEFVGEDAIDHTPQDELVRVKMGNAFDIVGERTRNNFQISTDRKTMTETFDIKLRNHKSFPATVRVVEHLYRWTNWKITSANHPWKKKDAQTIEFDVPVEKGGESVVTYTVKYAW